MQVRAFNSVAVDKINNIFTKSSNNIEKLKSEILYYLFLPKELRSFFPKLVNYQKDYSTYKLQYIPYKSLEELILNQEISFAECKNILGDLIRLMDKFHKIKPSKMDITSVDVANFYIKKTKERIYDLGKINDFKNILSKSYLTINGIKYKNFSLIENSFSQLIQQHTAKHHSISIIHGDFCFSNILYSPTKQTIKLIDPRGSFIHEGIYGHNLYDYAKLLHCVHSRYDFIVNDLFTLNECDSECFYFEIPTSLLLDQLEEFYKEILIEKNITLEFLYLIEASLFLSMASLHYENIQRQKILYLIGIIILNQVIEGHYAHMH
ncbi:hypothetical protein [Legionella sainthelensi]|uniref:Uncharacterized protein n=1 Tax=Legionella sainthelensi TaxID=28087 RepID=A0A2H5FRV0_9GAMM|nr:hypothetical protein [Legionella sainthelensi]AUH74274.1 hypothetical protein CAB17_20275 [Legionella sainthelensi]